ADGTGDGDTGGLDLAGGDPPGLECLQSVLAEVHPGPTLGLAGAATAVDLTVLGSLGHQHGAVPSHVESAYWNVIRRPPRPCDPNGGTRLLRPTHRRGTTRRRWCGRSRASPRCDRASTWRCPSPSNPRARRRARRGPAPRRHRRQLRPPPGRRGVLGPSFL